MSIDSYHSLTTEPAKGAPLVFAFHGTGGNELQLFQLAQELVLGAGVVSPRGDVSEMGAARFFRRTGEGAYDMDDLAQRADKMAGFVSAWRDRHPDAPVFGFGYSNGANILASVMMQRPDLFDRAGLLHPLIPWDPDPQPGLKDKRVLVTAGQRDPICPFDQSIRLIDWLTDQGALVVPHAHDGGHELRQSELAALQTLLRAD